MSLSLTAYNVLERALGRRRLWRIGRWLYLGSRRELRNDPAVNGEYRLQDWLIKGWSASGRTEPLRICDVGANVGHWAERAVSQLRAAGLDDFVLHACEPAPAQRRALAERLAHEVALGTVVVDGRGVSAEEGTASFTITGEGSGDSAIAARPSGGPATSIEVTTLDAIAAANAYGSLDLVKVDTEGNDLNVMLGARALFERGAIGALQFEYNWRWVAFRCWLKDVFEFRAGLPYAIGRLTQDGLEVYDEWHPELDRFIETNYLLVRNDLLALIPHRRAVFDGSNTAVPAAA